MQALQAVLRKLRVAHLVLPSVPSLRRMWTQRFGFTALTIAEAAAVEPHVIMLDSTSAGLLKKPLHAPTMCVQVAALLAWKCNMDDVHMVNNDPCAGHTVQGR